MSTSSALSRIPVLRILVPLAMGIVVHRLWHCWWAPLLLIIIAVAGYLWLNVQSRTPQGRLRWRSHFILPIALTGLALGWICADIHCPPRLTDEQRSGRVLTGRVVDLDYTDFSMRLTVDVLDRELPRCKVLVSTRGCDYTMQAGDLVAWRAALDEIGNLGNPGEMDYASHVLHNLGIRYQQHLPLKQVKKIGHSPTLMTRMANLRRELRLMVFNSRLSADAERFVSALLLGDNSFIDKATRQEFSAAGVAHVLALSGLHVGFIALIIWWMLFPLDYLRLKKLRLGITITAITLFAVFTGLSPSVVRATIMIGMVFASLIFYRRSVSLNALALAALLILVFSPSSLFSVGFQLSFITVGAILMFARLPESLTSRFKWVNHLTSTIITSVVAMLATVALCAYYFHTVSLMSVLANLLILPILPLFMVLSALFLLVTAAGMHWALLDYLLNSIYRYIHWAVSAVNTMPLSHIGGVYVSTFGVIAYFVIMALLVLWLYRRRFSYLLLAGFALAIMLAHSLWVDYNTPKQGFVIFNSFTSTPVLYFEESKGYVWSPDEEETDSATFARYYAGFLARHNISDLRFISSDDTLRLDHAMIKPPTAHLMGRRMLAVGRGSWKQASANHRLELDDLIVTKHYHGSAAKLQEFYHFDRLILSGAIYENGLLLHDCDSLGISVHDLATMGALVFTGH